MDLGKVLNEIEIATPGDLLYSNGVSDFVCHPLGLIKWGDTERLV
jgi:hypothetical protein